MKLTSTAIKVTGPQKSEQQKQSMWQKLVRGIIRPPRANYKDSLLDEQGLKHLCQIKYNTQGEIKHSNINTNNCTSPFMSLHIKINGLYCTCMVEATSIIRYIPQQFSLASFDFMGCGYNLEMDTVSLGWRQSKQVETVVEYLQESGYKVALWGRSMGAASALKYGKCPIIVADSSYSSFRDLCKEVALKNSPKFIPNCLIHCFFPCVFCKLRSDVQQLGQYDLNALDIEEDIKNINPLTVIIFMSGDEDTLIDKYNSEKLYNSYTGKNKYLEIFKGTHNTKRPEEIIKKIMDIIQKTAENDKNSKYSATKTVIELEIDM